MCKNEEARELGLDRFIAKLTYFFRRRFIFSLGSLNFWGLNNKVLTSTPVSNHGWNNDELPDWPSQDGCLASYSLWGEPRDAGWGERGLGSLSRALEAHGPVWDCPACHVG